MEDRPVLARPSRSREAYGLAVVRRLEEAERSLLSGGGFVKV